MKKQTHIKWIKCGYIPSWASRNWRLLRPINARTYKCAGEWFAESRWLNQWGVGSSRTEAMIDLMVSVFEWAELAPPGKLGPGLQREHERLMTYIDRRQAA